MKTTTHFFKLALVLGLAFSLSNCSKSDDNPTPNPEVNPLPGYLAASGFDQVNASLINQADYEFGFSFIPIVNGKITAFVVKIPDVNSALRVTIWNKATATVLKNEIINYATAGVEVTKAITALDVVAGTEYVVSFNSNDYYNRRRTDFANAILPFAVGDISITRFMFRNGSALEIPNTATANYHSGDISFKFQKS